MSKIQRHLYEHQFLKKDTTGLPFCNICRCYKLNQLRLEKHHTYKGRCHISKILVDKDLIPCAYCSDDETDDCTFASVFVSKGRQWSCNAKQVKRYWDIDQLDEDLHQKNIEDWQQKVKEIQKEEKKKYEHLLQRRKRKRKNILKKKGK